MQHAFDKLVSTVGEDSSYALKHVTTPAEDAEDARQGRVRAEAHSRLNLDLLHRQLLARRDACHNYRLKSIYDGALAPLQARVDRYSEEERLRKERIYRRKQRREEREFREFMKNWVSGNNVDEVESQLEEICAWQVEHAHQRDIARDKWRMRSRHQMLVFKEQSTPFTPLRWIVRLAATCLIRSWVIFPEIDEYLPEENRNERREDLVDLLWEWQGQLDVSLCDAYGVELFEELPDCVREMNIEELFLAGRDITRHDTFPPPPPLQNSRRSNAYLIQKRIEKEEAARKADRERRRRKMMKEEEKKILQVLKEGKTRVLKEFRQRAKLEAKENQDIARELALKRSYSQRETLKFVRNAQLTKLAIEKEQRREVDKAISLAKIEAAAKDDLAKISVLSAKAQRDVQHNSISKLDPNERSFDENDDYSSKEAENYQEIFIGDGAKKDVSTDERDEQANSQECEKEEEEREEDLTPFAQMKHQAMARALAAATKFRSKSVDIDMTELRERSAAAAAKAAAEKEEQERKLMGEEDTLTMMVEERAREDMKRNVRRALQEEKEIREARNVRWSVSEEHKSTNEISSNEFRPYTPTVDGIRNELEISRRKLLAKHLLRADLMRDIPTRLRVLSLLENILHTLSEFDERGVTVSAQTGAGGEYQETSCVGRLRRRMRYALYGPPGPPKVGPYWLENDNMNDSEIEYEADSSSDDYSTESDSQDS